MMWLVLGGGVLLALLAMFWEPRDERSERERRAFYREPDLTIVHGRPHTPQQVEDHR